MPHTFGKLLFPTVILASLVAAGSASAALTAEVVDSAGLFEADTIKEANSIIKDIKEKYKKDLLIETFKTLPADKTERFQELDRKSKAAFFQDWARERARARSVNGIYVLICKEPGHVQVEVGNETGKKAFQSEDRKKLTGLLDHSFHEKKFDRGLLEGVEYVRNAMGDNLGKATEHVSGTGRGVKSMTTGSGTNWGGLLCTGLVVVLVVWLVIGLFRMMSGAGGCGGAGGGWGGGGGFMTGLMGGLFGAMAGSWMYDHFFRGDHMSGGDFGGQGADSGGSAAEDTDYSGSGGDFGDGGDVGGGDFDGGGGDFGGGDF